MFTSPDPRRFVMNWTRVCGSVLSVFLLMTQMQCGGSDSGTSSGPAPNGSPGTANAIARENALPGSSQWFLDQAITGQQIVGYADRESYPAGAEVRIAVSAEPAGQFRWKLFRMGGYRGLGARLYAEGGPLPAAQRNTAFESGTGLVTTGWPTSFTISTRHPDGSPWLTGVYVLLFTKDDGWQSYAMFILRDDTRDAAVAVQLPTATWHAYNAFGGESCYASQHGLPGGHARKVSLARPSSQAYGSATFLYIEHDAVRWLEDEGYDVEYLSSTDIGGAVNRIGRHQLYISLSHEEYATAEAFDRLQAALSAGTSLAFLTGNTMSWQVRFEDNEQTMVCYKDLIAEDPLRDNPRKATANFSSSFVNRPENQLLGVMSDGSHNETPADWVVTNSNHWVYNNTGLSDGSRIPGIVFNEWDGVANNGFTPAGLTILASSVVPNNIRPGSRHEATIYERGPAFVFAAGSIFYSNHVRREPLVARMMTNLLARAGARTYQAEP